MVKKKYLYIDEYLQDIKDNPDNYCKEQKALLDFLPPYLESNFYDTERVKKMVEFIEKYYFKLLPFQKFLCGIVEGLRDEHGDLVFDEILFLAGRGTGKTGLISSFAHYFSTNLHGIKDYDIDIVANSEEQAKTSFNDIYDCVNSHALFQKAFDYNKQHIRFKVTNSDIRYVTSNAKTADGRRPGAVIFDEIHGYENEDNMNTNKSGLGKVDNFRIIYLTTDGYVRDGVLDKMKEKSERILFEGEDPIGFFPMIFKLDDKSEAKDESKWIKANPRIAVSRTLYKAIKKHYNNGLTDEGQMVEFLTKRMNVPVVNRHRCVAEWEDILKASEELPDLKGRTCIGAIDYAGIKDFCSVGLLFRDGDTAYLKQHTFIHKTSLENTKFNIPINEALEKGLVTIISDTPTIPPSKLLDWFMEQAKDYRILNIRADRYRLTWLKDTFSEYGIEITEVGNGYITHHKLYPLITKLFADGKIKWGDDMMMRWYTNNTQVVIDNKGNASYQKIEPIKLKTDGFFMLIHALTGWDELEDAGDPFGFYTF